MAERCKVASGPLRTDRSHRVNQEGPLASSGDHRGLSGPLLFAPTCHSRRDAKRSKEEAHTTCPGRPTTPLANLVGYSHPFLQSTFLLSRPDPPYCPIKRTRSIGRRVGIQAGSKTSFLGPKHEAMAASRLACARLKQLPHVPTHEEQVSRARKSARKAVRLVRGGDNAKRKNKVGEKQLVEEHAQHLAKPLRTCLRAFPPLSSFPPFERAVLELTVGGKEYEAAIMRAEQLRKQLVQEGKEATKRVTEAKNQKEREEKMQEALEKMEQVLGKRRADVERLVEVAKHLRRVPEVEEEKPTLVLVGAPNVGKSSLVRKLSTGAPQVCHYPFTTRSIHMGHFHVHGIAHQVTDTPGLLRRPDEERNRMERLTLAAIQYLPAVVLFVLDPTELCGTPWKDQVAIREELRERFPSRPWMDVLSKADLLQHEDRHRALASICTTSNGCTTVSALTERIARQELGEGAVLGMLPAEEAVFVSCETEEGIERLKEGLLQIFDGDAKLSDWRTKAGFVPT